MASFILASLAAQRRQATWSSLMRHAWAIFLGAGTTGSIARSAILDCRRLDLAIGARCRARGVDPPRILTASPLDKPNTVLILKDNSPVRLCHLGRERRDLACVFFYLDRPQDRIDAFGTP